MSAETCKYCNTEYEIPEGKVPRTERTADFPPPARVTVWAVKPGQRLPDFAEAATIHECRKGKPVE